MELIGFPLFGWNWNQDLNTDRRDDIRWPADDRSVFPTANYPAADMGFEKDCIANCSSSLMSKILSR